MRSAGARSTPAALSDIQPHAIVDAPNPVRVCVCLDPVGSSDAPTCLEGVPVEDGAYSGCCGTAAARLQFGKNLQADDAHVRIVVTTSVEACTDYSARNSPRKRVSGAGLVNRA